MIDHTHTYTHSIAETSADALAAAPKVDTNNLPKPHLRCLAELVTNVALLDAEKPTLAENEFEGVVLDSDGQLVIQNARYNTRVRRSKQVSVSASFSAHPSPPVAASVVCGMPRVDLSCPLPRSHFLTAYASC